MPPCSVCAKPTIKQCSRCKAFPFCSAECMKCAWPKHKPHCNQVLAYRKCLIDVGLKPHHEKSIPCMMSGEDILAANQLGMGVYEKYGIVDPPITGSTMDPQEKLNFFLDFLDVHDSSSKRHAEASFPLKLFIDRRYNNCMRHAEEHLTRKEFRQLLNEAKERRIGSVNK